MIMKEATRIVTNANNYLLKGWDILFHRIILIITDADFAKLVSPVYGNNMLGLKKQCL